METATAERWLLNTLRANPIIGAAVYKDQAPEDAGETYVIFELYSASDVSVVNGARVFSSLGYTVKAIGPAEAGSLVLPEIEAKADAIDSTLHKQKGVIEGGEVISSVRDMPISFTEVDEGKVYQHLGGVYLLNVI